MIARLALFLLIVTGVFVVGGAVNDWRIELPEGLANALAWRENMSDEDAIRADLEFYATPEKLDLRVREALDAGRIEDAELYADIARYMKIGLLPETQDRFDDATSFAATALRDAGDFAEGFATGQGETMSSLAGAITSDLTVIGDIRDIAREGSAMVAGEDYSEFILGLSLVGVAATAATIATGGGGVVVKAGVSILKFAKRAGTLTVDFARVLGRLVNKAVDMPGFKNALRRVDLTDMRATSEAVSTYARSVRGAELFPVLAKLDDINAAAGTAETVKLLRFVRTSEHLDDMRDLARVGGPRTRGIIELTAKTSLRAFKRTVNVFQFLIENLLGFLAWLGSLFLGLFTRIFRRLGSASVRGLRARSPG